MLANKTYLSVPVLASALMLSGCMPLKNPNKGLEAPEASVWQNTPLEAGSITGLENWWLHFEDPALEALVAQAMMDSPTLAIAAARVEEARGSKRTSLGGLLPNISGTGTATESDEGASNQRGSFEAGFDASWEIDLWGKNRNAYTASAKSFKAREAQYQQSKIVLISEIARTYTALRAAERQVELTQRNIKTLEETKRIIEAQKRVGEAGRLDVERTDNLLNSTRAQVPEAERIREAQRLALSVLVGVLPENLDDMIMIDGSIPSAEHVPLLESPSDVLKRRPDVRAAQLEFAAATDLSESAFANIFPSLTLGGFFGIAEGLAFDPTEIWRLSASSSLRLLDFGRLRGQIDAARARERIAFETYRGTILEAVADVETALSDYAHLKREEQALAAALVNAKSALKLSKKLYKEGEIAFLDVLDSERTAISADRAHVDAQSQVTQALIRLYKSLGAM
ncbi:MAG: TolC family protein [Pseudomonadota bacterium]|nr:TolC family protein [Pseudomonadota bacterium]